MRWTLFPFEHEFKIIVINSALSHTQNAQKVYIVAENCKLFALH